MRLISSGFSIFTVSSSILGPLHGVCVSSWDVIWQEG
jgi:hypothetical protein